MNNRPMLLFALIAAAPILTQGASAGQAVVIDEPKSDLPAEDKGDNRHGFKGPLLMFCHDWGIWDAYRRNRIEPANQRGTLKTEAENVGKWNQIEILVRGNRIRFVANGKLVFDFTDQPEMLKASPLGLQLHANAKPQEFHFRGLWISETPGDELVTLAE